jgi:predicted transcriptional regulator
MSTEFINKLESTKSIIEDKQEEIDTLFDRLIKEYNITNEDIKDAIYDYCYNDFESPILRNYLAELDED